MHIVKLSGLIHHLSVAPSTASNKVKNEETNETDIENKYHTESNPTSHVEKVNSRLDGGSITLRNLLHRITLNEYGYKKGQ